MKLKLKDIVIFAMLGTLMYVLKWAMEILPNIHLVGVFIVATTVVYRAKALLPLYVFVIINFIMSGFSIWTLPYFYVWLPLWASVMLLPKNMPKVIKPAVYMVVCAAHGFLFGVLYAPAQALLFGLDFNGTLTWIITGFPYDVIHGVSNFVCGLLICPIISVLSNSARYTR